jgi:metal-responsive CopG/Arc/MetJ family transcriptional regulator
MFLHSFLHLPELSSDKNMSDNNLTKIEIKVPIKWKHPLEQKIREKGYVTISEAIREYLRKEFIEA